ncbi:MAG: DUF6488 family protein [Pseudohongiellaceae bacterium]
MRNLIKILSILGFVSLAGSAWAHEGHEHAQQLDQAGAVETASTKMMELINEGALPSKWASKPPSGAQLARVNGRQNWVISYIDEAARERLELIFTMTGEYVSMTQTPVSGTAAY